MKYLVQTYHNNAEADEIFREESVGSGWYDYMDFRTERIAKKEAQELANDGFKTRVVKVDRW